MSLLAGGPIEEERALADVACGLARDGAAEVIVSLGGDGETYVTADASEVLRCPDVPIRRKVGARDSMVGGPAIAVPRDEP